MWIFLQQTAIGELTSYILYNIKVCNEMLKNMISDVKIIIFSLQDEVYVVTVHGFSVLSSDYLNQ